MLSGWTCVSGQTADMIADFDTHDPALAEQDSASSDAALPVSGTCSAPRQSVPSSTSNLNVAKNAWSRFCPKPFREGATIVRTWSGCCHWT